jgi:hypothetical protein
LAKNRQCRNEEELETLDLKYAADAVAVAATTERVALA